jgi:hypothetical protein
MSKRSSNFTEAESLLLESLVHKYKHILENKKTDAISNAEKEMCWSNLAKEYNSSCPSPYIQRDAKVLKLKHFNIKKKTKQKCAENKVCTILFNALLSKDMLRI